MFKVKYFRNIDCIDRLSDNEKVALAPVNTRYKFRANDYYLSLIDWNDPDDPIRKIVIPDISELDEFGELDPSDEEANYVAPGCQHKYPHTVLLLCTETCGCFCRFCFRKRLFMDKNDEVVKDVTPGIEYIKNNPQITNVLLSGGDPLLMSTGRLENIIKSLRKIDHVQIIRIGTKMPAFNPYRIIDDPKLPEMLSHYSLPDKRIYIMTHFNVTNELTDEAILALDILMKSGVVLSNQTPILKGINDKPNVLANLMNSLSTIGVTPYYFFHCRPTTGNKPYALTIPETYFALESARKKVSGLAKRARLVMSHERGKIEIVGISDDYIYLKYHRAKYPEDEGKLIIYYRNNNAFWMDDLTQVHDSHIEAERLAHQFIRVTGTD
ncbi:MAG: KamA family radical SAM protein [candidate division Zixibacteria bacterium]